MRQSNIYRPVNLKGATMNRRKLTLGLLVMISAVGVLNLSVSGTSDARGSDNTKEEEVLRALDLAWSEAANRKDLEAVVSYMADDGETLAPNEPAARGNAAIRASWSNLLGLPGVTVRWEPLRVRVAKSGELGYTSGTYTLGYTGADGKTMSDRGKYLEVWKKVNGKWKCSSDAYNSDLPAK
jgi:ketosteroid isomerase-like protein